MYTDPRWSSTSPSGECYSLWGMSLICWMLPLATYCHTHYYFNPFHFIHVLLRCKDLVAKQPIKNIYSNLYNTISFHCSCHPYPWECRAEGSNRSSRGRQSIFSTRPWNNATNQIYRVSEPCEKSRCEGEEKGDETKGVPSVNYCGKMYVHLPGLLSLLTQPRVHKNGRLE